MNVRSIQERPQAQFPDEDAIARFWWSLPRRSILPLTNGDAYQLLFAGRTGGGAGPDVRAAVLYSVSPRQSFVERNIRQVIHGRSYSGDVEFHIHVSDWFRHGHHMDVRYNNVILHVVLFCDDDVRTRRQDGIVVPVCALGDLPSQAATSPSGAFAQSKDVWPCQRVLQEMTTEARDRVLEEAGILRFEQKVHTFVETLHTQCAGLLPTAPPVYDACLIPILAEGLGYGRDRAFFHALGQRLAGLKTDMPRPLGRGLAPSPLDAERMQSLYRLIECWSDKGLWQTLYTIVQRDNFSSAEGRTLDALRKFFRDVHLSLARTDILLVNVVLPFAAAVALLEQNERLGECALRLYREHPGLTSNWITRMMREQLRLSEEPRGSCRQQGLHYIYRETCREKRCEMCIAGREMII